VPGNDPLDLAHAIIMHQQRGRSASQTDFVAPLECHIAMAAELDMHFQQVLPIDGAHHFLRARLVHDERVNAVV
jgi:hypothetical protein